MTDLHTFASLSGQDLAALCREADLTQRELAERAGVGRHTVIRWERKAVLNTWGPALQAMLEVLGFVVLPKAGPPSNA